jgi:hypothetical protein
MCKIITLAQLKAAGACADALQCFAAAFGESTPVTPSLAGKYATQFSWDWAAGNLLSRPARAEYYRACARARAEYDRDHEYARVEYDRAVAPAPAQTKRNKVIARAWATYTEAAVRAQTEYARACARAWATLYTRGGYNA